MCRVIQYRHPQTHNILKYARKERAMDAVDIGKRLIELRGNRTQEEVARANNISVSAIGMYERGERIPRDELKIRLAAYYNKTVQEIFYA